jgi:hypothetical protein
MISKKKQTLVMLLSAGIYVLTVLAGVLLLKVVPEGSIWPWLVTLIPLAGVTQLFVAAVWSTLQGDELQRRTAAIAAVATLVLFSGLMIYWGLLEAFVGAPAINPIWWGALAMGAWSLVQVIVWKWYQ